MKENPFKGKHHTLESRKKMSEALKKRYKSGWSPRKGKKHTNETKERISKVKKENPTRYWLGKKRSKETIEKIRKTKIKQYKENKELLEKARNALRKARNDPVIREKWIKSLNRYVSSPEARKANSKRRKLYYKNHPEAREKQKEIAIKVRLQLSKGKETNIEKIVREELERRNIEFQKQKPIGKFTIVDFLIGKNIVVYCDGDYWHSKAGAKEKDAEQVKKLTAMGYKVFRFKGSDIEKDVVSLIDKVTNCQM